ncbi:MAG: L,D-transpeptidase family protein [Rhizobiales bacterium]|nr:L,D-transpeptidase family protein [Hyphomicrobiales bacterium]MBI3672970.1 L,D-transpeptidase family protein [Hyphomicrobiales bacterium]
MTYGGSRLGNVARCAALAAGLAVFAGGILPAHAEPENSAWMMQKRMKAGVQDSNGTAATNWSNAGVAGVGRATTETRIVNDGSLTPFLSSDTSQTMQAAEQRYAQIVADGGWGKLAGGRLKKGSQGKDVAALNRRLFIEGYVRQEATEGQYADIFTSATADAVSRYQANHGLEVTGAVDNATLMELNVPAEARLATIRANLPRVAEYSKNLGNRYVVVNIPAAQIESVENGKVFSIHNAIVGRPLRPTPVVATNLVTIKFSPYWNAPASIVERDIVPRMLSGGPSKVMNEMNMKIYKGVGGPEVDPDSVDWRRAVVDDYQFRQEPGGENAMKTVKIEFNSPFGIYLHDTPEPRLFESAQRFYSSGCVRIQQVAILLNWILRGQDGITAARIAELADTKERLDVTLKDPPQLRVAYLTAWPGGNGTMAFRPDVYEVDGSGFVIGQPMPVGSSGPRFVLTEPPRSPQAVDAAEASGFFASVFGRNGNSNSDKQSGYLPSRSATAGSQDTTVSSGGNWTAEQPAGKKTAKATKLAQKKKLKKATDVASASAKPGDKMKPGAKPADKATVTAKPSDKCKPGTDGKLPAGCPTAAAKPNPKANEHTTATN